MREGGREGGRECVCVEVKGSAPSPPDLALALDSVFTFQIAFRLSETNCSYAS